MTTFFVHSCPNLTIIRKTIVKRNRILVCEDNHLLRKTLVNLLRLKGYSVLDFADAEEVLSLGINEFEGFDLLLTDIEMPGTNGLELSHLLKSYRPEIKIVLMSGHEIDQREVERLDASFFAKPFCCTQLLLLIEQVLAKSIMLL